MDYKIALFRVRSLGACECLEDYLPSFARFRAEYSDEEKPVMTIIPEKRISLSDFENLEEFHTFSFDAEYATCHAARYSEGYTFWMVKDNRNYIFTQKNGSGDVLTNMGHDVDINPSLLRFALWFHFGLSIVHLGGIAIHSSVVVKDGAGVLCLGESGTGKSTHTRLWLNNIEGTRLLNDDSPIIRIVDNVATVFGSPWSGKTHCYHNISFPIKAFMRLSQAPYNKIHRLNILNAIGALLPSCPPTFGYDTRLEDSICDTLSEMISRVPVYHLECLPDRDACLTSYNKIYGNK